MYCAFILLKEGVAKMDKAVAFIDTQPFWSFDYGANHPLKMWRLQLTQALQQAYGLLDKVRLIAPPAQPPRKKSPSSTSPTI